jgi:hypothetical protein
MLKLGVEDREKSVEEEKEDLSNEQITIEEN